MTCRVPRAYVEWKGLAAAVHYQGVAPSKLQVLFRATKEVAARNGLAVLLGAKVWDLVPPGHRGKSNAVSLIRRYFQNRLHGRSAVTVFAGDDATDAEAFLSLKGSGIAVQVGKHGWTADYHLTNVSEVHALLRWIERRLAADRRQPRRGVTLPVRDGAGRLRAVQLARSAPRASGGQRPVLPGRRPAQG